MWPAHSAPPPIPVYSSAHSIQYLGNQAMGPAYHRPYSTQTRPFDSISETSALAKGTASPQGLVSSEQSSRGRPRYAGVSVCCGSPVVWPGNPETGLWLAVAAPFMVMGWEYCESPQKSWGVSQ